MLLNENTAILTPRILLVPYSEHHVPTYHEWMQDETLQKATASEPLTLDEEYAMQRSWRTDADKLTFIACTATQQPSLAHERRQIVPNKDDTPNCMIGDINLFLCEADDEEEDEEELGNSSTDSRGAVPRQRSIIGEIEIMVARKELQGAGYGRAILLTFMAYILSNVSDIIAEYAGGQPPPGGTGNLAGERNFQYLRVKIDGENIRSIRLFESVGFQKLSDKPNYFGELELRWHVQGRNTTELQGVETICVEYISP